MKRGKHVTKRFFPAEHTLSYSDMHLFVCMFVCVCSLADEHIVVPIEVFVCGEWKQKKTCVFPLQRIAMTNDARPKEIRVKAYAVHAYKHTIQIHLTWCVRVATDVVSLECHDIFTMNCIHSGSF